MNTAEIDRISDEIKAELSGLRFGKVFQLTPMAFAVDFFPHSGRYLYIGFGPRTGRAYLIRRRLKDLERVSVHQTPFIIELKKIFAGFLLVDIFRMPGTNVLRLEFNDADGNSLSLAIQLGRHRPNVFILDKESIVISSGKADSDAGQRPGDTYKAPEDADPSEEGFKDPNTDSLSELLDAEDTARSAAEHFDLLAAEARRTLNNEIRKRAKLVKNLENDLLKHGDPDIWKRYGDLLLANIGNLRQEGENFIVIDYFDTAMGEVSIPSESNASPSDMAEVYFKRYAKARNGAAAIAERLKLVRSEIDAFQARMADLESAVNARDTEAVVRFLPQKKPQKSKANVKRDTSEIKGARRFISTDGFEILVGKKAVDNDFLTFRVARSQDTWLHAADYPGSHVIIRNPGKKDLPNRTLIEGAQLAAFYSDARELPKAAVRYTARKFVNKPRKSAPGLVSLSSFKTILVEPKIGDLTST